MARGQMRPREKDRNWNKVKEDMQLFFGLSAAELVKYDEVSKADLLKAYTMMELSRQFENACNQVGACDAGRGWACWAGWLAAIRRRTGSLTPTVHLHNYRRTCRGRSAGSCTSTTGRSPSPPLSPTPSRRHVFVSAVCVMYTTTRQEMQSNNQLTPSRRSIHHYDVTGGHQALVLPRAHARHRLGRGPQGRHGRALRQGNILTHQMGLGVAWLGVID